MIIDAHSHIEPPKYTPDVLTSSMDEAGIDYSLLLADRAASDAYTSTEDVIKISQKHPRLKAIGCIEYKHLDDTQILQLIEYLKEGKIHGVKLYPGYENYYPLDEKLFPFYEECQKLGKPLIFHTGHLMPGMPGHLKQVQPLNIDDLAFKFPDLKIVMAHFGNPWVIEGAMVVAKNKNVYADLSGYFSVYKTISEKEIGFFKYDLKLFWGYAGGFKKRLFGTDFPLYSQKEYLEAVRQIPFSKEEEELVFWKNAKEIFGLDV